MKKCFLKKEQKNQFARLGDVLEENSKVEEKYTISDRLLGRTVSRRKKEHKIKGNGFGFLYLILKVLFVIQSAQDTTKMGVKY